MNEGNKEDKKYSVEKYLDQVKILTALATTLLVSPNLIMMLRKAGFESSQALQILEQAKKFLLAANISFLVSIIMTYFIYSSVVGYINVGKYDIFRLSTRIFSIIQFFGIAIGCIALLIFFIKIA